MNFNNIKGRVIFFFHKITRIYAVETEHNNGKTSTVTSGTDHY